VSEVTIGPLEINTEYKGNLLGWINKRNAGEIPPGSEWALVAKQRLGGILCVYTIPLRRDYTNEDVLDAVTCCVRQFDHEAAAARRIRDRVETLARNLRRRGDEFLVKALAVAPD